MVGGLIRAFLRWQRAAGPYWPYVCAAPFVSGACLPVADSSARGVQSGARRRIERALDEIARTLDPTRGCALFVDASPIGILATSLRANAIGWTIVPIIQRWVAPRALIDCRPLVEQLIVVGGAIKRPRRADRVVFVLDGERFGPPRLRGDAGSLSRFDNRYDYPTAPFPPSSVLRRHGIDSTIWLAADGVAPDVASYASSLAAAGLHVEMIQPRALARTGARADR